MALLLLLVLAGGAAAREAPRAPAAAAPRETKAQAKPPAGVPARPFATAPLPLGPPLLESVFRLADPPLLDGGGGRKAESRNPPEQAPSRVVCPMPVIKVSSALDPGFVVRLPEGPPDPIIRDDLSRCVE